MSEIKPQENQQELFSDFAAAPQALGRGTSLAKAHKPILISTTLEQLLLCSLILILVLCLVFFLGVLRGRYITGLGLTSPISVSARTTAVPEPPKRVAQVIYPAVLRVVNESPAPKQTKTVSTQTTTTLADSATVKPYTIQIMTTKKKAYAENEALALRNRGVGAWMMRSGEYYVVCVGAYKDKGAAKKDLSSLKSKYRGAYLRHR